MYLFLSVGKRTWKQEGLGGSLFQMDLGCGSNWLPEKLISFPDLDFAVYPY